MGEVDALPAGLKLNLYVHCTSFYQQCYLMNCVDSAIGFCVYKAAKIRQSRCYYNESRKTYDVDHT